MRIVVLRETAALSAGLLMAVLSLSGAVADPNAENLAACQRESDAAARLRLCSKVIDDPSEIEGIRAEALLNRGLAHAAAGEDQSAIADYAAAIKLNPDYGALYQSRGEAYFRSGAAKEAIADFTSAIGLDPRNALALSSRAAVYMHVDDYAAALADFEALLALDPADADALAGRGLIYERKGDTGHAAADYRKALEIEGSNDIAAAGLERLRGSL
jgi:tetratricopeptide (TPR) repeat protein